MLRSLDSATTSSLSRPRRKPPIPTSSSAQSLHHHHHQHPNSLSFRPQPQQSPFPSWSSHLHASSRSNVSCSDAPNKQANQPPIHSRFKTWAEKAAVAVVVVGAAALAGAYPCRPSMSAPIDPPAGLEENAGNATEEGEEEGYVRLLERDPRDMGALKMAFYGEMRKGKMTEAAKYVERMRDVEPWEVEWRLLQALTYELMGELGKAKKMFLELLEEKPLLVRALHGLALVLHKNHEDAAVFEMLNKALELAHREHRVIEERNIQILIAQMHAVMGDLESSLKRFQELVDENPRDFRPFLCQGIIYSLLGKKTEADQQFENYRSLVPEEFPQRSFLDDVVLLAKTEPSARLKEEFECEFSFKK